MSQYTNGIATAESESPFADRFTHEIAQDLTRRDFAPRGVPAARNPFSHSFETANSSPVANEYVQLLSELHDTNFADHLYEVAAEIEEKMAGPVSYETTYLPQQFGRQYFAPFIRETHQMIDRVKDHFAGDLSDRSEGEIEMFFQELALDHQQFTPAQEQLFGSVFKKVKSVVKKGVDLAKKGAALAGKLMPLNFILDKIKGLINPLLERVLKFAINKLPKNLQPFAHQLAKKFLNINTGASQAVASEVPATADLESIQMEFDNRLAQLVLVDNEVEADQLLYSYEHAPEHLEAELPESGGGASLEEARQQLIHELKTLGEGESPAPAIERFLPVAMMAVKPMAKMAISMVGRPKVISFLAGLLSKLVERYIPRNVAMPLASSIVDIGMSAIGFETAESSQSDLAYEAIANTVEDTIRNMEVATPDEEALSEDLFASFETAAADHFPAQYIRPELRRTNTNAVWVLKPRKSKNPLYKKYTSVFNITIDPAASKSVTVFRNLPLASFLKDKLGLDPNQPIQAKMHLYEAINGTRLSRIALHEQVPGLGKMPHAWVQLHPLTQQAAGLLLKEPALGRDFSAAYVTNRYRTAVGQRFYYLEINGARLRVPNVERRDHRHGATGGAAYNKPGNSGDVQAVVNFIQSEIKVNYYFSEEEAKSVVEQVQRLDFTAVAQTLRHSIKNVLNEVLRANVSSKVKIVHESVPELYLANTPDDEGFSVSDIVNAGSGIVLNAGKDLLHKLVETLTTKVSESAYGEMLNYFKT
ncbi:MAG TPA: hypothetical protein VFZ78_10435, partial [Flavisolibacter sp.]